MAAAAGLAGHALRFKSGSRKTATCCALIKLAKSARNGRIGSRMAALFARECDRK